MSAFENNVPIVTPSRYESKTTMSLHAFRLLSLLTFLATFRRGHGTCKRSSNGHPRLRTADPETITRDFVTDL